jgi:hypothetical protein
MQRCPAFDTLLTAIWLETAVVQFLILFIYDAVRKTEAIKY